ncbi:exo-alpha-sialidase [Olivibacter sp. SDN3]|uniref:sialidase family protein n=1 Tax=Olivibacter sp. SDN3 TaxID=2764720 RepID=UPI0016510BA8|nr:sialidase family protein [Olivibacter sp. SDN3]QNL51552.1 exo-alpha-sialidase [Olivibacter sp. SDN3]
MQLRECLLFICCLGALFPLISCQSEGSDARLNKMADSDVRITLYPQKDESGQAVKGIPAYDGMEIDYQKGERNRLHISFGDPVIVSKARDPQPWGHYQFPTLHHYLDSQLVARIHLSDDAVASYGKTRYLYAASGDDGTTWKILEASQDSVEQELAEGVLLPNGDRIKITTPPSIHERDLHLPESVGKTINNFNLYPLELLPKERQGIFLTRLPKGSKHWQTEQAKLLDSLALRYTIKGEMPVVWWGDLHLGADGSIYAGVYPGYYLRDDGTVDPRSGIFFYQSTDMGHTWEIQGRIPYAFDHNLHAEGERFAGFTEPTFEILPDSSFLCVMRTTDEINGPMYASRSTDKGVTWTKPAVLSATGVLPRLLQLENGILVLSYGRPGVQLRFSQDGGDTWTEAFEMLPYDVIDNVDWFTTCGYTSLLPLDSDRFLLIYSDFFTMNERGELRKSIKVREIDVTAISK